MRVIKKIISAIVLIAVGTILVLPIEAKISNGTITIKWLAKNYYSKKQSNSRFDTKSSVNTKLDAYYKKTSVDSLLASYLTTTNATATYLTQTDAASTYLTQSNATSTYLPLSGGALTGGLTGTTITGTSFAYSSAQTKSLVLPANDFADRDIVFTYTETGNSYYKASGTQSEIDTGVNLPNGAEVTAATLYAYDNSPSSISAAFYRKSLTSTSADTVAFIGASAGDDVTAGWAATDSTIDNAIIDNDNYSYHFQVSLATSGANLYFRGAKITYTVTDPDN